MTWFKVDDTLAFHAKVVAAGNPAMGLWVRAGAWAAQQLTDGFVPSHMVKSLGTPRQASTLVSAGLWVQADGGFRFHDWNDAERQPTRQEVEDKRQAWREKKREQRAKGSAKSARDLQGRFSVPGGQIEESPGESPGVSPLSRPVPSRPITTSQSERGSSVAREDEPPPLETSVPRHVLPSTWGPTTAHQAYAMERGVDINHELRQFRSNCRSKRTTSVDWDAEFDKWLGNARAPATGQRRSTDDKVRAGLSLAARLAAEEQATATTPQIGA